MTSKTSKTNKIDETGSKTFSPQHTAAEWEKNYPANTDDQRRYWDEARQAKSDAEEAESLAEDSLTDLKNRLSNGDATVTAEMLVLAEREVDRTRALANAASRWHEWYERQVRQDEWSMRKNGRTARDQKVHNEYFHATRKRDEYRRRFPRHNGEEAKRKNDEIANARRTYSNFVAFLDEQVAAKKMSLDMAQGKADAAAAQRDEAIEKAKSRYQQGVDERARLVAKNEAKIAALEAKISAPVTVVRR